MVPGIKYPEVVSLLWYFVLGTLAAFGALCALWVMLGWLLPVGKGCALVCWGSAADEIFTGFKWLRGLGLLHCPLIVVTEMPGEPLEMTENCRPEQLLARLEQERNRFDGTGNGDPTGRGQCRGISEL